MLADGDAPEVLTLREGVHTHNAFCCLELVFLLFILDILHLSYECFDVLFLLSFYLFLKHLIVITRQLLYLPLEASDVVDSKDVIVPLWVGVLDVKVYCIYLAVNVALYALSSAAEHDEPNKYSDSCGHNVLHPASGVWVVVKPDTER